MTIRAERSARWLDVVVHDDGRGLPDGFSLEKSDRLGLQIVRTLVSAELDGSLGMHDAPDRRYRRGAAGADRPTAAARSIAFVPIDAQMTFTAHNFALIALHTVTAPTFVGAVAVCDAG